MSLSFTTAPVQKKGDTYEAHPFGKGPRSFAIPDDTIDQMVRSVNMSRRDGKERGFHFCIDPSRRVKGVSRKFRVLKAAPRCVGDACSLELTKACPDETIRTPMFEWQSPGQIFGDHHTHPGGDPSPSVVDMMNGMIDGSLYKKPVIGCVSKATGAKGFPAESGESLDPTVCWVMPDNLVPTADEMYEMVERYNEAVRPMYAEWGRTGEQPAEADWPEAAEAYRDMDGQLDAITARVVFDSILDFDAGKVLGQYTGDKPSTEYHQNVVKASGGKMSLKEAKDLLAAQSPSYFDVNKVEMQKKKDPYEPGFHPIQVGPTIPQPKVPQEPRTFIEEFGSLENCLKGVFPGGGKMTMQQLHRIARANGLAYTTMNKTQICEALAAMGEIVHA